MTAPIDIANRALAQVKAGTTIATFTENSVEADACDQFYAVARDNVLAQIDWAFARRFARLPMLTSCPSPRWRVAYRYPSACLKLRELMSEHGHEHHHLRVDHAYEVASDDDGQIIMANLPHAIACFTARVENPDAWSTPFAQAVVFLLASYIAIPITGNQQLATANLQYFQQQLATAELHSAQEAPMHGKYIRSAVEARL